jgi:hypothetical protein
MLLLTSSVVAPVVSYPTEQKVLVWLLVCVSSAMDPYSAQTYDDAQDICSVVPSLPTRMQSHVSHVTSLESVSMV